MNYGRSYANIMYIMYIMYILYPLCMKYVSIMDADLALCQFMYVMCIIDSIMTP